MFLLVSDSAKNSDAWAVTPDRYAAGNPPRFGTDVSRSSCYVTMRDGIGIAVDVHLPKDLPPDEKLPALLINTPYYRRFKVAPAEASEVEASPNTGYIREFFVPHGYAVVVADVRGTGASFGSRDGFRSPREREDFRELADWLVAQPWSDGTIGSTGISYVGASADFLATTGHPAVKAVIPSFAVWDTYSDQFYLGGLLLNHLPHAYGALADALDHDDREALKKFSYFADPRYDGPAPVDGDANGQQRDTAIAEHFANFNADDFLREFRFRDTGLSYDPDYNSALIGPAHYAEHTNPDTAYYCVSGWMDGGGFGNAAIRRFLSLGVKIKHLIMGPWDHGARTHISPFRGSTQAPQFELMAEYLRFFDHYVKGVDTGLDREQPIHYFTMGEETWRGADQWPLSEAETTSLYLAADGTQAIDEGQAFSRGQQCRHFLEGFGARRFHGAGNACFVEVSRCKVAPEKGGHRFERHMPRKIFDVMTADHQAASLSVDLTQYRFGCDNAFETRIHSTSPNKLRWVLLVIKVLYRQY